MQTSYILFTVGKLNYALPLDQVHRIIMLEKFEQNNKPNSVVEGMMSFEDNVINVASFRKMVNLTAYSDDLKDLFLSLKEQHVIWLNELKLSVENNTKFTKSFDPHMCQLGKWLDSFHTFDSEVAPTLRKLVQAHNHFHESGIEVVKARKESLEKALEELELNVKPLFKTTCSYIDELSNLTLNISKEMQKLLVLRNGDKLFGLIVDKIDDILHTDSSIIQSDDRLRRTNKQMNIVGVLEHQKVLRSVIDKINIGE
ncbi:MAG: hypothetical protein GQ570_08215 [Helicobacteraceae bacterium]|nr:hypothetical protein [Helicobacteraceae bacterium]